MKLMEQLKPYNEQRKMIELVDQSFNEFKVVNCRPIIKAALKHMDTKLQMNLVNKLTWMV